MSGPTLSGEEALRRFEAGEIEPTCFTHREHVQMGFELARRAPFTEAADRFARALKRMVAAAGQPENTTTPSPWPLWR